LYRSANFDSDQPRGPITQGCSWATTLLVRANEVIELSGLMSANDPKRTSGPWSNSTTEALFC
jgi:hypothetical protein